MSERSTRIIPFDYVVKFLVREPFNQPWTDLKKLDPVSARLLFFRDPERDELYENDSAPPPQMRAYLRFHEKFKKAGYTYEHVDRLWEILEAKRTAKKK